MSASAPRPAERARPAAGLTAEQHRARLTRPSRLAALHATGMLDGAANPVLDRLARLTAQRLDVPVALVSPGVGANAAADGWTARDVRLYRGLAVAAAAAVVGYGVVFHRLLPRAVDPWSHRAVVAAACLALAAVPWDPTRRRFRAALYAVLALLTAWLLNLLRANAFAGEYAIGLLMVAALVGAVIRSPSALATYAVCTVTGVLGVATLVPAARLSPPLLASKLATVLAVLVALAYGRRRAARGLAASEMRFRTVVESIDQGLLITDREGRVLYANARAAEITGYAVPELIGRRSHEALLPADEQAAGRARLARRLEGRAERYEVELVRKDGSRVPAEIGSVPFRDAAGATVGAIAVVADTTERKALEAELWSQARRDALTGLANRTQFRADLTQALADVGGAPETAPHTGVHAAANHEGSTPGASESDPIAPRVSVLFVDLDDFKAVNDSQGHAAGDALLAAVADRLRAATRGSDTVARLGGDEFAVLLRPARPGEDVGVVVPRILHALARPIAVAGRDLYVSASVGVARATPGVAADDLLRHADVAMYRAKAGGKHRCAVFSAAEDAAALDRAALQTELAGAAARGELALAYQPVVDLATGHPIGAEALARWRHPARGLVPPDVFIPIAEATGLMPALGRWVLETACAEAATWPRRADGRPPRLAVNVSGRQLEDPTFLDDVISALRVTGFPAERLTLEVTESVLLTNPTVTRTRLEAVRALGVQVACDDFGTGYSSLTAVRELPLDSLKIDQAFTRGLVTDATQRALTEAVVQLARALNLKTVAEGVETAAERDVLLGLGCPLGQGYFYARPLDPAAARAFFADPDAASNAGGPPVSTARVAPAVLPGESPPGGASTSPIPGERAATTGRGAALVVDDDPTARSLVERTFAAAG